MDVAGVGAGTWRRSLRTRRIQPGSRSQRSSPIIMSRIPHRASPASRSRKTQDSGGWEYSTDNGTTWNDIPTSVSASSSLVLATSDLIRFVPNTNYSGSVAPLNVYGLDSAYTGGFTSGPTQSVNVNTVSTSDPVALGYDASTPASLQSPRSLRPLESANGSVQMAAPGRYGECGRGLEHW